MRKRIGMQIAVAALIFAALAVGPVKAGRAGDGFFPHGEKPTASEVKAWAKNAKAFRESLRNGQNGRFSAVRIDGSSVFLLDTRQGHMWVWTFGPKGSFTAYQGQLVPGLQMGDIVGASAARPPSK